MSEVLRQAEDPRPAGQHHITAPNGLTARRFVWTGHGMRIIIGREKSAKYFEGNDRIRCILLQYMKDAYFIALGLVGTVTSRLYYARKRLQELLSTEKGGSTSGV